MSGALTQPHAIIFEAVRKDFRHADRCVTAIDNLTFVIPKGEYACILGRSGCGKSTAANLLVGLEAPTAGRIAVLGMDPVKDFARLRGRLANVFQSDRLLPWRTAIDNVRLPLEILRLDEQRLPAGPAEWLGRLGLQDFENAYPHQLSGGMRSRVALARALVAEPDIIIADEAFAHLDEVSGERLRREFHQLAKTHGKTVVHITHSIDEAISLGDRILVLGKPGHIVADLKDIAAQDRGALRTHILSQLQAPPRSLPAPERESAVLPDAAALAGHEWAT
jgi:NitT/TauT family transport system ATP-binding protein